ncbi:MAG: hypothetical protein ACI85O_000015 [Saprospiraceae bacterium]|jgi:hypothetical protein
MFARAIFSTLAIIAGAVFAYSHFYEVPDFAIYSIIPLLPAAIVFVMSPQINWWWYTKNPSSTDNSIKAMLKSRLPFYKNLSETDKKKFEDRVNLFIMAKEFTPKIHDDVPEDMKAIIAASAVMLTFHKEEDWIFDKFEQYIVYPHPFPTPQYEEWHICENFEEDGVMLFSAQHLLHGFFEPHKYYQIALHEFVNVFLENYSGTKYPQFEEDNWADFEKISNFSEEKIKSYIGLQNVSLASVGTTLFFTHREIFAKILPKKFSILQGVFGE